ncbi:MAG: hypothetical protein WDZ85_02100 [Candidatus Paceibacterota bacterium]
MKIHSVGIGLMLVVLLLAYSAEAQRNRNKLLGDGREVAAQTGANPQSQVELISIPADPSKPTFYVTVEEPFVMAAQDITSGGGITPGAPEQSYFISNWLIATQMHHPQAISPSAPLSEKLGYGMAAQLTSVLTRIGNLAVIDYPTYRDNPGRYPEIFVIRGTVTEFTETDGLDEQKKGFDTKIAGRVLSIIGGGRGLGQAGNLISSANVGQKKIITNRTGVVGLDIQLIQTATGRVMRSTPCQGTFTTQSATEIQHGLGFSESQSEYQASALNQASRAALNQAATEIWQALATTR